jgi:Zn-dependent protease
LFTIGADMFLLEPERTQFDLQWRMFGIHVRVHPMFWLIAALLGWGWYNRMGGGPQGLLYLLLWVFCVFLSVLIHELGHVVAGRCFGSSGNIVLYSFGGLAIGSNHLPARWQRIIVSLAGPGAQILLFALLYWAAPYLLASVARSDYERPVLITLEMLLLINLFWPILNLLPIWPLDGGQVTRELCEAASPTHGRRNSLLISLGTAVFLIAQVFVVQQGSTLIPGLERWVRGDLLTVIFLAMFAVQSFQMLQDESNSRRNWDDDRLPWER